MVRLKTSGNTEEGALQTTMKSAEDYEAPQTVQEPKSNAIFELPGLTDEEKYNLVLNRVRTIVEAPVSKMIPTLAVYREGSAPPVQGIINVDCDQFKSAWEFYKANVKSPNSAEFVQMVCKCIGRQPIVYQRVVQVNLL